MNFGNLLKELREGANFTQEEAAKKIGVSITTIQNWEYSKNLPDIENLKAVSKAYNMKFVDLINYLDSSSEGEGNKEKELPHLDLLPANFNIEKMKSLDFTKNEIDLFVGMALNIKFDVSPIETLISQTKSNIEAYNFMDRLLELGLINAGRYRSNYTSDYTMFSLTNVGAYILDLIRTDSYFDIYNLRIDSFLELAYKFKIIFNLNEKLDLLKFIHDNDNYIIKKVEGNSRASYTEYPLTNYTESSYHSTVYFKDRLEEVLESDYYTIIKEESTDKEYLEAKSVYLKKLEVYNANKELLEGAKEPTFNEVYVEYIKLSDKGNKLYKALDNIDYFETELESETC